MGGAATIAAAARHLQGWPAAQPPLRVIVDAIRYLVRTGCAWRLLPSDFPPPGTVYWWFAKWAADGTLQRLHQVLREQVRVQAGRAPTPTAAIVDSQSVRAADTVPRHSRGWDAGKKVNGRKRHLAVDTMGLLLIIMVTAASVQDRDAARALLWQLRSGYQNIRLCWADAGYAGKLVAWAAALLHLVVEIVRKRPGQSTFDCPAGGWWSGRLPGSASTAAACATTSACPPITPPWSPGPWSR